jgi:hypothetical protein
MTMPSTIETHPERAEIEAALREGETVRAVAERFGLTPSVVGRHRKEGLTPDRDSVIQEATTLDVLGAPLGEIELRCSVPGTFDRGDLLLLRVVQRDGTGGVWNERQPITMGMVQDTLLERLVGLVEKMQPGWSLEAPDDLPIHARVQLHSLRRYAKAIVLRNRRVIGDKAQEQHDEVQAKLEKARQERLENFVRLTAAAATP